QDLRLAGTEGERAAELVHRLGQLVGPKELPPASQVRDERAVGHFVSRLLRVRAPVQAPPCSGSTRGGTCGRRDASYRTGGGSRRGRRRTDRRGGTGAAYR